MENKFVCLFLFVRFFVLRYFRKRHKYNKYNFFIEVFGVVLPLPNFPCNLKGCCGIRNHIENVSYQQCNRRLLKWKKSNANLEPKHASTQHT